jgi:hypothetical protein
MNVSWPDERVGHDLERERRKRRVVGCRPLDERFFLGARIDAHDRRHDRSATAG